MNVEYITATPKIQKECALLLKEWNKAIRMSVMKARQKRKASRRRQ
jgi:hypothetical protein